MNKIESLLQSEVKNSQICTNSISKHLCKHKNSCKISSSSKSGSVVYIKQKLSIHRKVKESGKYNFEGCNIRVNIRINVDYMRRILQNYKDLNVRNLLEYGFPISFKVNENEMSSHDRLWKYKNHREATDFPDEINASLEKESGNDAILGPFKNNPLSNKLIISPLNSVSKKYTLMTEELYWTSVFQKNNSVNDNIVYCFR